MSDQAQFEGFGFIEETGTDQSPFEGVGVFDENVATGLTIDVPLGTLTVTVFAPTISQSNNRIITVPAGSLTLTGHAPTVQSANFSDIDDDEFLKWMRMDG